jgi:DNA-binding CsgD family transcriptional regulator
MGMRTTPRATFSERARSPLNVRRAADAIEDTARQLGEPMDPVRAYALAVAALSDVRYGATDGATIAAMDPPLGGLEPVQQVFLAPRQLQVLKCAARGLSSEETAKELYVTVNTVRTHLRYVRKYLKAHDRGRMVALGFAYGLLTVDDVQAPVLREWPVNKEREEDRG